ncbi:ankyrin repeat domain-containing protein [Candidatus Avelusimicrobium caledoniensis]|uniref:ankyrin repeat domain-containing protein n=1 Tax=Candidatus Avelusimicrobium caledoniensis TaxID=3416220 RepID=UPI003D0E76A5
MNKKLPYLIALSALAVCLPAVSQAQGFVKGAARAVKGGKGAVKIAQTSIDPGLKLRVERAIAEQRIKIRRGVEYQRTPQEAAQRALNVAIYRNESDLIKPLIARGAEINSFFLDGTTLLTGAVELGNLKTVKEILQNGADINMPDRLSKTPLIMAAQKGNYDMVKFLLDNGAKVDLQDAKGFTALMRTNNEKIAKLLLDKGADPNHQEEDGWTKLMYIANAGYKADEEKTKALVDLATLLLKNGAEVNLRNHHYATALILALDASNFALTKLLLEHGADPYMMDDHGRDAFDVATWGPNRHRDDLRRLVNSYKK